MPAALVPPPRLHLLRYHGVLAPRARARDRTCRPSRLPSRRRRTAIRARRAYGWVCPQRSLRPRIDPDTGPQATKLYCVARSKDGQTILRELPDPGGALSALTESPKRCLILPILPSPTSGGRNTTTPHPDGPNAASAYPGTEV